jgi:hypothetical protein
MQAMGDGGVCDNDNQNYEWTLHETFTKVSLYKICNISYNF